MVPPGIRGKVGEIREGHFTVEDVVARIQTEKDIQWFSVEKDQD